ncbi:hypothetical protein APHAL10511_002301 [Amanita phalloides]|nr:hypothetical protein APHAL10511_002301 [Amanita phalloides]
MFDVTRADTSRSDLMALPTPPRSSNKENNAQTFAARGVAWAQHTQIHHLSSPPPPSKSVSRDRPARSILKKQSYSSLPLPDDICDEYKPREVTPEPADPLCNLTYLEHPVSRLIASDAPLKDLIEAHNVLAARLRSSVTNTTDVDASWPLFQPIRKNRDAFVKAIVRDLGRALVDPLDSNGHQQSCGERKEDRILAPLPSPNNTPKKKRDGMTAEQVKCARDQCTISHSVIRLLSVVWTMPAILGVFSGEELGEILTQLLAIPLAPELPTLNARKTCALAIWLIQSQRLPRDVLAPAADRIAAALKRAIDGELGKEGKKGSVSDGLKAIHDLCMYQPVTFVKAFAPVLPYVLQNLVGPTLTLRVQACQALGGIVTGANRAVPRKGLVHARFARLVRLFLTRVPKPSTQNNTVPSTPREPLIIRTLRLTLEATDPQHSAQGPVWALNVLAALIALLGPLLIEDHALRRTLTSLLSLGLRHPKSSVRALACIVWRPVVWAWFQPSFSLDIIWEDVQESIEHDLSLNKREKELKKSERKLAREKEIDAGKDSLWKLMTSVVECQTGVVTIAALLGTDDTYGDWDDGRQTNADDSIQRTFSILKAMTTKGGLTCQDAVEVLKRLVGFEQTYEQWHINMLLPRSLFSSTSNLLFVEFKSLSTSVRSILEKSPGLEEIRSLTREELSKEWVFNGMIDVWKEIVGYLEIMDQDDSPITDISEPWDGLIKANVGHLLDGDDDAATIAFTGRAADILVDIVQDQNIDFTPKALISAPADPAPKSEIEVLLPVTLSSDPPQEDPVPTKHCTNGELKLKVVRDLWATVRTVVPHSLLAPASEKLLLCLIKNEDELLDDDILSLDICDDGMALKFWMQFCTELAMCCDIDVMKSFWGIDSEGDVQYQRWRRATCLMKVWRVFVDMWKAESVCTWESCAILLRVPFMNIDTEGANDDDSAIWESLLDNAIAKALDHGLDNATVLEDVAAGLVQAHDWDTACGPSVIRAADALLSRLDLDEIREVPSSLLGLINAVLVATYPPSAQTEQYARWVLRSVSDLLRKCSEKEMACAIATAVKESVSMWILDEARASNEEEWAYDMEPLYGYLLSALGFLPKTIETLNEHLPILESALLGGTFRTPLAAEAFKEFWSGFSDVTEPRGGWPAGIPRCLGGCKYGQTTTIIVGGTEDDLVKTPEQFIVTLPPSSSTLCEEASDLDRSTVSPPSTPTKHYQTFSETHLLAFSSPPRLKRLSPTISTSLRESSLISPTWVAVKNKTAGSRKRMRISVEKENNASLTSPTPSIPEAKQNSQPPMTPRKRKVQGDLEDGEKNLSPLKKCRSDAIFSHSTNTSHADDTDDEDHVASNLLASSRSSDETIPSPGRPKKRKRTTMIMAAVEVPTLKSITASYAKSKHTSQNIDSVDKWNDGWRLDTFKSRLRRTKSDSSREPSTQRCRSAAESEHDLFGPLPLPNLLASYQQSATISTRRVITRSGSASAALSLRELDSKSLNQSPPSSPSPQARLMLDPVVDDSENEDTSAAGSSPSKSARLRKIRRTRSQTITRKKLSV